MPTPDRFPGAREEEELKLLPESADPSTVGAIRLVSGVFRMRDDLGVFDPRQGGTGISEATHKVLRQLIHFIESGGPAEGFASGAYRETLPAASVFPTSITWWETSGKLKKIVERLLTWTGAVVTTDQWKVYDTDGVTVLATVTDTIAYSGIHETSRTRTIA